MTGTLSNAGREDWAVLFASGAIGGLSDAGLLARFASGRGGASAEAAFSVLVDRHGPMVLGVCRRVAGDRFAADDCFQAVFLVLARKARSVRLGADDSLGRWLYGVSLRVARKARNQARRRAFAATGIGGLDPIDPSSAIDPCERADLRDAIDAEIARLPPRYRSAVILCLLEGLPQEQAARRLRCPVGTVQSRLHRGRERLRSALVRRGLAPAVGVRVGALETFLRAAVPTALARRTATVASKISAGEALAGAVSAGVAGLVEFSLRSMMMRASWIVASLLALGLATTAGAVSLATGGDDDPKAPPRADAPKLASKVQTDRPEPALAETLDRIKAEYEAAQRAYYELYEGSTIPEKNRAKAAEIAPDFPSVVRRVADLAATDPKSPAVRDVMLWMMGQAQGGSGDGPYSGGFALAADWLVHNFGDDPDAVRVGLGLDNIVSLYRDNLLLGFYASAKGREAMGLSRLALAQYLEMKAMAARGAREVQGRRTITYIGVVGEDGKPYDMKKEQTDQEYAYLLHLKQCDVDYLRAESERLYEEVIADYGDVPFSTARQKMLEALLEEPEPKWNGEPLKAEDRRTIEASLARRPTLGQAAEARLDNWHNLAEGKAAPEIEGVDVEGNPLKLSDYRGKVVALVFWGTWCGPCMREVPREKALVETMKGRPFAMLGVDTDADPATARKAMDAEGMTWPNWHDGEPGAGPITQLYHVRSYPTVYVIDAEGKIRSKKSLGESLDKLVEDLVAEREAAGD